MRRIHDDEVLSQTVEIPSSSQDVLQISLESTADKRLEFLLSLLIPEISDIKPMSYVLAG
jgi:hypothetical protein